MAWVCNNDVTPGSAELDAESCSDVLSAEIISVRKLVRLLSTAASLLLLPLVVGGCDSNAEADATTDWTAVTSPMLRASSISFETIEPASAVESTCSPGATHERFSDTEVLCATERN
eukprot:825410-Prymnesium_polylepis.2